MRFHRGLILTTLLVVGAGACASGGGEAPGPVAGEPIEGDELPMGIEPRDNEHTREADRFFNLAAQAEQDSAFAEARQQYQQALDAAVRGIRADSTNPKSYYQAGLANLGVEDFVAADSMLVHAVDLHPRYELQAEPLREQYWVQEFNAGVQAIQDGNRDEALRRWEKADAIWKGRPEAMLNLGATYANQGELEQAADAFAGAIEAIEGDAIELVDSATAANWRDNAEIARQNLAQIYTQLERYDEAVALYEDMIARDPGDTQALTSLALILVRTEQTDSAQVIYERLLEQPDLGGGQYFNIGIGLYQMEAYAGAVDAFGAAAEANPYNRDALQNLGQSLFQNLQADDDLSEAAQDDISRRLAETGQRLMEIDPYSPAGYELTAQGLVRLGDDQAAVRALEEGDQLPFNVVGTILQGSSEGGGTVTGQILNRTLAPGTTIQIRFTFYSTGDEVGTTTVRVQAPAEGESTGFEATVEGGEPATGFSYEVIAP